MCCGYCSSVVTTTSLFLNPLLPKDLVSSIILILPVTSIILFCYCCFQPAMPGNYHYFLVASSTFHAVSTSLLSRCSLAFRYFFVSSSALKTAFVSNEPSTKVSISSSVGKVSTLPSLPRSLPSKTELSFTKSG